MSMQRITWSLLSCLLVCAGAIAQIPITNGDGATLEDLVREQALVTILLKGSTAADRNARITGVYEETISILTSEGENTAYPISLIGEIRVQDERLPETRRRSREGTFSDDDEAIVNRAAERAMEVFEASRGDQRTRMAAALTVSASGHEGRSTTLPYLQELASGNDVPTAILATTFLYLAGLPPDPNVLREGFLSGNREARAGAATLVGLTLNESYLPELRTMLKDTTIEVFPAAAKAIGRMGDRTGLPELYESIRALRDPKAEAAVFALIRIGGDEVKGEMEDLLRTSRGMEWFRVLRVLFALGDPGAKETMKSKALTQPAYERVAALLILNDGDWDGTLFLRKYLKKAEDPNLENLLYRGEVGAALFMSGDGQAKLILQELINIKPAQIYARGRTSDAAYKQQTAKAIQINTLRLVGGTGAQELLSLLVGPIESTDPAIAVTACMAAIEIRNSEFGARLREARL